MFSDSENMALKTSVLVYVSANDLWESLARKLTTVWQIADKVVKLVLPHWENAILIFGQEEMNSVCIFETTRFVWNQIHVSALWCYYCLKLTDV